MINECDKEIFINFAGESALVVQEDEEIANYC